MFDRRKYTNLYRAALKKHQSLQPPRHQRLQQGGRARFPNFEQGDNSSTRKYGGNSLGRIITLKFEGSVAADSSAHDA